MKMKKKIKTHIKINIFFAVATYESLLPLLLAIFGLLLTSTLELFLESCALKPRSVSVTNK